MHDSHTVTVSATAPATVTVTATVTVSATASVTATTTVNGLGLGHGQNIWVDMQACGIFTVMIVVIVAAGMGKRLGMGAKAFIDLGGHSMLEISAQKLGQAKGFGRGVAVVPLGMIEQAIALLSDNWMVVEGGKNRMESVGAAVDSLADEPADALVMVHDAARPFVSEQLIQRVLNRFADGDADLTIPGLMPVDAVKFLGKANNNIVTTIGRDRTILAQTPQVTTLGVLRDGLDLAHRTGRIASDEAQLIEWLGGRVTVVNGERSNFKITDTFDMEQARWLIGKQ